MDYGEFWLLERVLTSHILFSTISDSPGNLEMRWYTPWHRLDRWQLVELVERLLAIGDIVACDRDGKTVAISRDDICREFVARPWKTMRQPAFWDHLRSYSLSAQGGARWEAFSGVDWNRFHSFEWDEHEDDVLEIAATTPEAVERAFDYVVPWNSMKVVPETVTRTKLSPWSATYWKTLEVGYSIRFKCDQPHDFYEGMPERLAEETRRRVNEGYEFFHHWYNPHPDRGQMRHF